MTDHFVETLATDPAGADPFRALPGYVRSFHLPEDETAFHLFEGMTLEQLRDALARGAVRYERILEVHEWSRHKNGREGTQ